MYNTVIFDGVETHCNCFAQRDTQEDRAWWGHHADDCRISVAKAEWRAAHPGESLPAGCWPGMI